MGEETLAQVFWSRVERSGARPAQEFKRAGRWETLTWRQLGEVVREVALGLIALGRERGDAVALLAGSRAEWVQADFAILSAGGVTIPIYPTYPPDLIAYIVNDSDAKTLFVEDPGQLAKVLEVRGKMEGLQQVVLMTGGEAGPSEPGTLGWAALRQLGRASAERLGSTLAQRIQSLGPEDVASIVYTSGTTGPPKGVVQTHGNHVATLRATLPTMGAAEGDVHLLFLPLAHAFARMESFLGIAGGFTTAFAESLDTVAENLKEVRPHFIFSVPRVYEKVYARVLAGAEAASPLRKRIFHWAVGVGREVSRRQQEGRPIPAGLAFRRRLADRLVFTKLHAALGGRLRFAGSGGAPLAREIAEFFHAAGILLVEGYGLTETCPILTSNGLDHFKFGSVGRPVPGIELRIAPDGEILARGPNIARRGYYRQPEATQAAFDAEGWFHTGDVGRIDEDGFLYITDRKKDLIITAGGMNIAPQNIENALKSDPFISQAMVYGDRRPYPVALITVNAEELGRFAQERGLPPAEPALLVRHAAVTERVGRAVDLTNATLPSYARIKRFAVLPGDFTQEGGQLTPTLKVKRRVIAEQYCETLEALYR